MISERAVQPVNEPEMLSQWELFVLYAKVDELTKMVNELVQEKREK